MLSNQTILESKFQELDTRVMGLQVSDDLFEKMSTPSFQSQLENLPTLLATSVGEQNNRLWQRLESHVQTQLTALRQPLPTISVTSCPQRQNTV